MGLTKSSTGDAIISKNSLFSDADFTVAIARQS